MVRRLARSLASSGSLVLLAALAGAQTTWHVDVAGSPPGTGTAADPYTSLQYALAQAATVAGDTVLVAPGTYLERIDFLGKDVAVRSTGGPAATVLDGAGAGSVVTFANGEGPLAVLEGFTVRGGLGVPFGNPPSRRGGGILALGASPTLRSLVVRENQATHGAGLYLEASAAAVVDSTIERNGGSAYIAGIYGTGIWASGPVTVERCTLRDNNGFTVGYTAGEGGGAYGSGAYRECTFRNNRAYLGGGARGIGASFVDCLFEANGAYSVDSDPGRGGGVHGGDLLRCTLVDNAGGTRGGGAFGATLVECTLARNRCGYPTSSSSYPESYGAGAADSTLTDCVVVDNVAGVWSPPSFSAGNGGGVGWSTATRCTIRRNVAHAIGPVTGGPITATGWGGGGAYRSTLVDCDVLDNVVVPGPSPTTPAGGGLFGGEATRCRIAGNRAHHGAGAADAALTHCTSSANLAAVSGGGLASIATPAVARNSILWHDSAPETFATAAGGLSITWSDVEGGFAGAGNFAADPRFVAPASDDYRLLAGSPCIDAGHPGAPPDPDGTRADVGAYPFECGAHRYCVGKANPAGCAPAIGWSGTPSFSGPDDFFVTASNALNQRTGLLIWSRASAATPFAGGTLCLAPPLQRTPPQGSGGSSGGGPDCSGTYSFHFSQAYLAAAGVGPLETIFAQYYSRDPLHPDGSGVALSDAVAFTVCP